MNITKLTVSMLLSYVNSLSARPTIVLDADDMRALGSFLNEVTDIKYCANFISIDQVNGFHIRHVGLWVAVSSSNEKKLQDHIIELAKSYGIAKIFIVSFINDILPKYFCAVSSAAKAPNKNESGDRFEYAIMCTPRSGSTFLGEALTTLGLGRPKEHLRDTEIEKLIELQLSGVEALGALKGFSREHERANIFGTKLISHFMFKLISEYEIPSMALEYVVSRFKIIYLLRENKVLQAISDYFANRIGVWHVRTKADADMLKAKISTVAYSYDDILHRYNKLMRDEVRLFRTIVRSDYLVVFYEELSARPHECIKELVLRLGLEFKGTLAARVLKPESEINLAYSTKFIEDYRRINGIDPVKTNRIWLTSMLSDASRDAEIIGS